METLLFKDENDILGIKDNDQEVCKNCFTEYEFTHKNWGIHDLYLPHMKNCDNPKCVTFCNRCGKHIITT